MEPYSSQMVTVIVRIAGDLQHLAGAFPALFNSRRKQTYLPIRKKSPFSLYYHWNYTLFPLLVASLFPVKGIKCRLVSKREFTLLSWRKMNSQQGNPAVTNTTQRFFLPLPAAITLTPKDRECCTLQ